MSSIKHVFFGLLLFLLFPLNALADVKVIVNPPVFKSYPYGYNQHRPNYYTNKRFNNRYNQNRQRFNKYNFAPYSYRSQQHNYSLRNRNHYSHDFNTRPSFSRIYNYNPYANNYNRYQHQREKAYWRGYKDAIRQQRNQFKLGK